MANILSLILDNKKKRVDILKKNEKGFVSLIKKAPKPKQFIKAIKRDNKISLIAELKQASPSAGILQNDFSFTDLAKVFMEEKANAISVLTEEDFFLGKISYIEELRRIVDVPILRKDFIIDEIQVLESRAAGADAILLIARLLDNQKLVKLHTLAKELGMDTVVEVHTERELRRVLHYPFDIIGINNRNLDTFQIDLNVTAKLLPFVPKSTVTISESGIKTLKDVLWLKGLGVHAILVGEVLMKAPSLSEKIKELHIDG